MSLFNRKKSNMVSYESVAEMGKEYIDEISDFKGKCVGITFHITGCTRVILESKSKDDGKLGDAVEFDITRLIDVDTKKKLIEGGKYNLPVSSAKPSTTKVLKEKASALGGPRKTITNHR